MQKPFAIRSKAHTKNGERERERKPKQKLVEQFVNLERSQLINYEQFW